MAETKSRATSSRSARRERASGNRSTKSRHAGTTSSPVVCFHSATSVFCQQMFVCNDLVISPTFRCACTGVCFNQSVNQSFI